MEEFMKRRVEVGGRRSEGQEQETEIRRWETMTTNLSTNYPALLGEIKQRIRAAQYEALKAVNKELIALYWDIGG